MTRRILFSIVLAALMIGAIESASWVLLETLGWGAAGDASAAESGATPDGEGPPGAPDRPDAPWADMRVEKVLHPYVGYVHDPTSHSADIKKWSHPEARDQGFAWSRRRILQSATKDRLVVAVIGGSVANQIGRLGESLLKRNLQLIPRFEGRKVDIVNLGMGAFKQPQQLMALNYLLALGGHFDLVLNIDGFNEVALAGRHNRRKGVNPFFPAGWHILVGDLGPASRRLAGELSYLDSLQEQRATALEQSPLRFSPTTRLLWTLSGRRRAARIAEIELELLEGREVGHRTYQGRGPRYTGSDDELLTDLADVWRRSSIQMQQLCSGLGVEYYHFLQPNQYDEGSKPLNSEELEEFFDEGHPYREAARAGYPMLRRKGRQLARAGVSFRDLSRLFAKTEATVFKDTCCHFNDLGIRRITREIVRTVDRAAHQAQEHRGGESTRRQAPGTPLARGD